MKPRKPLPRSKKPIRRSPITRGGKPIPKSNPKRQAKRRATYKAYLNSAAWKKLRLAVFERDGFQCTGVSIELWDNRRCPEMGDERTGRGLICDHLTYARFGHENLEDLQTLCRSCNARLTKLTRPNWMNR